MRILSSLISLFLSFSLVAAPAFNRIIVFGDSLSDNGNLYEYMQHQLPKSPPYFKGRFSNGPTWVELIANEYASDDPSSFLLDYAFGGAGIYEGDDDEGMFTLKNEIKTYLLAHNDQADPESLYVVWIGANNYLALPEDTEAKSKEVTEGIRHGLETLIEKGARKFLVLNIPDLSITPIAHEFGELALMKGYSDAHNQKLELVFNELMDANPQLQWKYYDVMTVLNEIVAHPQEYGVTNINDTCYDAVVDKGHKQPIYQFTKNNPAAVSEEACDGYLFFDPVHPTKIAHEILAKQIKLLLESDAHYG